MIPPAIEKLIARIELLPWHLECEMIRSDQGDCPILADAFLAGHFQRDFSGDTQNWTFSKYLDLLGLSGSEGGDLARAADNITTSDLRVKIRAELLRRLINREKKDG